MGSTPILAEPSSKSVGWAMQHNPILLRPVCDRAGLKLLVLRSKLGHLLARSVVAYWASRFAPALIRHNTARTLGRAAREVQVRRTQAATGGTMAS